MPLPFGRRMDCLLSIIVPWKYATFIFNLTELMGKGLAWSFKEELACLNTWGTLKTIELMEVRLYMFRFT